jgi:hypothetical protein
MQKFLTNKFYRVDLKNRISPLLAGRFGSELKTYQYSSHGSTGFSKLVMELAIENYRLVNCPFKPSRGHSIFLFLTEADARSKFNEFDQGKNTHAIFEVTVDDIDAKYHIGGYERYLPKMEIYSELYWNSVPDGVMELIVESDVTIQRVLT